MAMVLGEVMAYLDSPLFWRPCGCPWLWRTTSSKLLAWVQYESTSTAI